MQGLVPVVKGEWVMQFRSCGMAGFLAGLLYACFPAQSATFTIIGKGEVTSMSNDGGQVLGTNYAAGLNGIWDHGTFRSLPFPSPYTNGGPNAISANGNVFAGSGSSSDRQAIKWTGNSPQTLGDLAGGQVNSSANALSADGSILTGIGTDANGTQPVRWTSAGIERLSGGTSYYGGTGLAISDDGSIIVGQSWLTQFANGHPFRWTALGGMQLLDGGAGNGGISCSISPDGSIIVGQSNDVAFRWTSATGMQSLGTLLPSGWSIATDLSDNGSIIVGQAYFPTQQSSYTGFIWDATHGMRNLTQVVTDMGFNLQGQVIELANAVSADGNVISGRMWGPLGGQIFVLAIPEPATPLILTLLTPWLLARRSRRSNVN